MSFDLSTLDPNKVTATIIVSPGVEFEYCKVINFDSIWESSQENNHARNASKDANHVQSLQVNFSNGIYYERKPPIVRYNPREIDGVIYEYELLAGHHRLEAMKRLGYDRWIFWSYKVCLNGYSIDDCRITLQLRENDHDSTLASTAEDASGAICWLINHGSRLVENTEESIRAYVADVCRNMNPNTRAKVVRQVMSRLNTYRRIVTFTSDDSYSWIKNNTDYTTGGNYDKMRNKHGWSVLEGYEYEQIFNAIRKYKENGRESYFVCRTKAPTKASDLHSKRTGMVNTVKQLEDSLLETFNYYQENGKFPWQVECFIPQDSEMETKNKPVFLE